MKNACQIISYLRHDNEFKRGRRDKWVKSPLMVVGRTASWSWNSPQFVFIT